MAATAIDGTRGVLPNGGPAGTLTGGGIDISNRTGGVVTFTDQVTITGATAFRFRAAARQLRSTSTAASTSRRRSPRASAFGLNVLTVANAGSTTINATGQTALSLQGTLGAGGVNFDSITSSGGASGIIFNGVTGAVNVSGATSITGTSGFGIDVIGANTGTFTFGAVTVNNTATAGGGINVVSGTVNVTGLANIDTTSGVGLSQSGGTTSFTGGLTIDTTTGTAISGNGGTMGITATGGSETVNSTLGQAINLSGVAATIALDSTSSGGGTNNVSLANVTGTVSLGSGALSGASGVAFLVNGGSAAISYGGSVTKTAFGNIVDISGVTGGTVTLSGELSATGGFDNGIDVHTNTGGTFNFNGAMTLSTGASPAVSLVANTGAVINFGGAMGITTTSGTGFSASGWRHGLGQRLGQHDCDDERHRVEPQRRDDRRRRAELLHRLHHVSRNRHRADQRRLVRWRRHRARHGQPARHHFAWRRRRRHAWCGAELRRSRHRPEQHIGRRLRPQRRDHQRGGDGQRFRRHQRRRSRHLDRVDLRGAIGGQVVRLGDAAVGGASSSIAGVNTGVFLNSTTNLAFTYGDGESATDQNSTIGANVGIDASSAPVAGTYNFQDVNFQASPGLGFGVGKIYFVGASATGDGTGRDQSNLATLSTAEAASASNDVLVLVNDGGVITAAGSNGNDTLALATRRAGARLRQWQHQPGDDGALHHPACQQQHLDHRRHAQRRRDTDHECRQQRHHARRQRQHYRRLHPRRQPGGCRARHQGQWRGASGTIISHMTIQNFLTAGVEITPSTSTGIDNVTFAGNASDVIVNALNTTITNVSSTGATGIAFDIRNTSGTTTLTNVNVTTAASGTGIVFGGGAGPQGTITGTNVDVTGGAGGGIKVIGGNAAITFDAASFVASTSTGTAVTIANRGGGSFGFAGAVVANGAASGISVSGATAANTVSFSGMVDLGTTTTMIGSAVAMDTTNSTVSFADLDIVSSGATGFSAIGVGTVNVTTGTLNSTSAQAINLNGIATTTGINFTSTTSTGGSNNVALANVTGAGTVSLGTGALSGASGTAFLVSGGSANISYGGSVTKTTAGNVVNISSRIAGTTTLSGNLSATGGVANGILVNANTGGTINFSGTTKTLTTGANNAVDLTTNTNTAINFTGGGLAITTTSGIGFNAAGGGTLSVSGSGNTISTGSGVAVNLDTVISTGGITFASTNKGAGGTSAVILDTVTGSGAIDLGTGALSAAPVP